MSKRIQSPVVRRRSTCRVCGSSDLACVIDLGAMPLAGAFPAPGEIDELRLPLKLWFCRTCTLLQILDVVSPDLLFHDYRYLSSVIPPLVRHFELYAEELARRWVPRHGSVVEMGCNDGVLLQFLRAHGIRGVGVDVSENITIIGRQKGHDIRLGAFDVAMAAKLRAELGPVDVVTGSNMFAHVDDVNEIVRASKVLLKPSGYFIVEVHYVGDVLTGCQYDTLYHEHLCEYSFGALRFLMERHGLRVIDVQRLPVHGGSIRVVSTAAAGHRVKPSVGKLVKEESGLGLHDETTWLDFGTRIRAHGTSLRAILGGYLAASLSVAAYGAPGRGTILLNANGIDRRLISFAVDDSPLRAGRRIPGTGIPIRSAEALRSERPDVVLILAWNYAEVILAKLRSWFLAKGGMVLIPLPAITEVRSDGRRVLMEPTG